MLTKQREDAIQIQPIDGSQADWRAQLDDLSQKWVQSVGFTAKSGECCLVPDAHRNVQRVLLGMAHARDVKSYGALPAKLTEGRYAIASTADAVDREHIALCWLLGSYRFDRYKKLSPYRAELYVGDDVDIEHVQTLADAQNLVRTLINLGPDDLGPEQMTEVAEALASDYGAECEVIVGEALLKQNFPAIYHVGKGCDRPPRLIDLRWGDASHPKVTLVGKGVCFDTGGLNLKPASGMRYMKKDMGGAAHVLGLAKMIMASKLPVRLRVLCPTVENAISGRAYHPGDVVPTRQGLSIEITNTDAEGRMILSDALTEASSEQPELLIDFATLTGAARIAVGTDISAMFCNDDQLAQSLSTLGDQIGDPIWRLPLFQPYFRFLESPIADMVNANVGDPSGGATVAALFLQQFVGKDIPWVHFDIMAWNNKSTPAHPEGGEAMAVQATYRYLLGRYG